MEKKPIIQENLLELGFNLQHVSAEESGDESFEYLTYEIKNICIFITDIANEEGFFYVEFFNYPEIGIFDDYDTVKELIRILKVLTIENKF